MKARLPQGMGGGAANMQSMLKKMQEDMAELQEDLEQREYSASVGGGTVAATVDGGHRVKAVTIKPEAVDPDDVEMLQDLVAAAVNEAMRMADETADREMAKLSGGLQLPGMF